MPNLAQAVRDITSETLATETRIVEAPQESGLAKLGEAPRMSSISGDASSAVYRVDLTRGQAYAKRSVAQLKVAAVWRAPLGLLLDEIAWIQTVVRLDNTILPGMPHAGAIGANFVAAVDCALDCEHAQTSRSIHFLNRPGKSAFSDTLRIDPYLVSSTNLHLELIEVTPGTATGLTLVRITSVHRDMSPKALCLNRFLSKYVWHLLHVRAYVEAFDRLLDTYLPDLSCGEGKLLDARPVRRPGKLWPSSASGKSPVGCFSEDRRCKSARRAACAFLDDTELDLASPRRASPERLGIQ